MELHLQPPGSSADEHFDPTNGATPPAASSLRTSSAPSEPAPAHHADGPPSAGAADSSQGNKKEAATPDTPTAAAAAKTARAQKRRRRRALKVDAPAWAISVVVHVAVLMFLALYTFSSEVKQVVANINSALVANPTGAEEMVHIYADPSNTPRESAVGSEGSATGSEQGGGATASGGIGSGLPSATPRVAGVGRGIGEKTSLPGVKVVANVSGLGLLPATSKLGVDLGGGGMIGGDVTYETKDVGVALDQLAREILRHLGQHKLTVVWLFDESESMKDDQKAIREKFDRVASELKVNADAVAKKKAAEVPLTHAIVGFGNDIHFDLEKPTPDVDRIGQAIEHLKIDDTGTENTMHALGEVINRYAGRITKDRRLLIVLVTDESGDDGSYVEEAHQAAVEHKVPIYVIGRQSLFGYERAHLRYVDPVTKDVYWPTIRRGPETADIELLQWDGLHNRWDEQASGFAPYELARLAKDSGGIYFLLPSEENMRVRRRESAYSMATLKEYVPDYDSRLEYVERRNKSEFRRTLYDIIQATKDFPFRWRFPIFPAELIPVANEWGMNATERLKVLLAIQRRLEDLQKLREREPSKRWQAHYDLMLAQTVAFQVKAYEYRALMKSIAAAPPQAKRRPSSDILVQWVVNHSGKPMAPKLDTAKKYAEADRLLKGVILRHAKTPWADLAQDIINRGLSVQFDEEVHSAKYYERAQFVPKY
jgi:von Willebrand factor type A domain